GYISDHWNKFDFVISVVGVVGLASGSTLRLNVFRLFRIARLLRLINKAQTLKILFWTLIESAPSLWNVGLLLLVIFFIYAIIGMNLFGGANIDPSIRRETNFDTFLSSFNLLYQVATQDNWTDLYACYLEAYYGTKQLYSVYLFFISFFIFGTAVLINLFIAVVLDSFQENKDSFAREEKLETIKVWRDLWLWFEPQGKGKLNASIFLSLLRLTPKPTGFSSQDPFEKLMLFTLQLKKMKRKKKRQSKSGQITVTPFEDHASMYPFTASSPRTTSKPSNQQSGSQKRNSFLLSRQLSAMIPMSVFAMSVHKDRQNRMLKVQREVSHKDMLLLLRRLKLLVHRNTNADADLPPDCEWYVKYEEALVCLCAAVVGPELHRDNDVVTAENMRIERWYAETYSCQSTLDTIIRGTYGKTQPLLSQKVSHTQENDAFPLPPASGHAYHHSIELMTLRETDGNDEMTDEELAQNVAKMSRFQGNVQPRLQSLPLPPLRYTESMDDSIGTDPSVSGGKDEPNDNQQNKNDSTTT
ncbi:voltage-gated cation channel, partial [Reticulomyxa filosa]